MTDPRLVRQRTLTVVSLLSLILLMAHLTDDVLRQAEGSVLYPIPVVVFALWLYATLVVPYRAWNYVVMLLGGIFSAGMLVIHSRGFVVGKGGGFFFVWTMFALSTTGWVEIVLSMQGLVTAIRSRRGRVDSGDARSSHS